MHLSREYRLFLVLCAEKKLHLRVHTTYYLFVHFLFFAVKTTQRAIFYDWPNEIDFRNWVRAPFEITKRWSESAADPHRKALQDGVARVTPHEKRIVLLRGNENNWSPEVSEV